MNFYKRKQKRISDNYIYTDSLITRSIYLSIMEIDKNLKETITKKLKKEYEGKCIVEGYIKTDSCQIVSHSSGLIKGVNIIYDVVFRCKTCFPVEGMNINCIAINITKSAGIRAEIADMTPSPAVIFITRDHHYNDDYFSQIKEGDRFSATVIGQRFELNDKFISIIAKLIEPNSEKIYNTKPSIIIDEETPNLKQTLLKPKSKSIIYNPIKQKIILEDSDEEPFGEKEEEEEEELVLIPKNLIINPQEEDVFDENKEDEDLEADVQAFQEDEEEELEENP
jgi:DNA-directed RNA polymerase subunit E'/Rpb7